MYTNNTISNNNNYDDDDDDDDDEDYNVFQLNVSTSSQLFVQKYVD